MEDPRRMVAVGGTIRVANGCEIRAGQVRKVSLSKKFLPLVQTMEYIRAFLIARLALSRAGVLTIISGAFGIFRRNIAVEVGGMSLDTVGEDFELVIKIHRYLLENRRDYRMRYVPEPVCWTEAPETWKLLGRQRARWERGALETLFKHGDMLLNPKFGRIGMLGFPYALLVDVLGPFTEVLGYIIVPLFYLTGLLSVEFMLAYTALTFIFGIFISTMSLILEEMELHRVPRPRDLLTLTCVAVLENFGYRQINNFWRVLGWYQFIIGRKAWGEMKRKGLARA
jgi:cellulose synthase/poly-beta-1,6-N-acetylglucosamine synthase-like glycosyltransferase